VSWSGTRRRSSPTFCRHSCSKSYDEVVAVVERTADELKTYTDAGATDVALLPLQTDPADLRRVWEVAAAF